MDSRADPARPTVKPGDQDVVERAIGMIRQRGGRSTTSRRAVLEALLAAGGIRRTAEELAADIQAVYPSINESTVYRNLDLLEQLGLVSHVHLGHGPSQWHLADDRHHWYLTCSHCGQVLDPDPDLFAAVVSNVARTTGFVIDPGHFAVTGTCAACAPSASTPQGRPNQQRPASGRLRRPRSQAS